MSDANKRIVVKIGSALITDGGKALNDTMLQLWAKDICQLQAQGHEVVLVSSGAIAAGMVCFGWSKRPKVMAKLQAAAALGQSQLVQAWEHSFGAVDGKVALILLDADDLSNRQRYLNARAALLELCKLQVVPIINENDTVVTDEIRFGDNDSLAGLVANLIDADLLLILTDQMGLYTADPRKDPKAKLVAKASVSDTALDSYAQGSKGALGRGGMQTKLRAARLAARSGTDTYIGSGVEPQVIVKAVGQSAKGTYITADIDHVTARKRWLSGMSSIKGTIYIDQGAADKLAEGKASLLPVGAIKAEGEFERGDLVLVQAPNGTEVARGLINCSHSDFRIVAGKSSRELFEQDAWYGEPELIHRDNLVLSQIVG